MCPLTTAGARDRTGFIDAPHTGPANIASSPMTAPTATPAVERIIVGNYQCQDLATTRQQIEDAGLRVGDVLAEAQEFGEDWLVFGQTPGAGREVGRGRRIDLFVVDPSSPCP